MKKLKKRIVILYGAGAAHPWGGQLTGELTRTIINISRTRTKSNNNFLSFLQKILAENLNKARGKIIIKDDDTNFEILLSLIEYLYEFFYYQKHNVKLSFTPEWVGLFNCIEEIKNEIPGLILMNDEATSFKAYENNPHFRDYPLDNDLNPATEYLDGNFFRLMHDEVIKIIRSHVFEYSKNSNKGSYDSSFLELLNFLNKKSILRVYSTNYDDFITDLDKEDKLTEAFFNGFETIIRSSGVISYPEIQIPINEIKAYNLKRILESLDENCFFNLHGSVKFIEELDEWGVPQIQYERDICVFKNYESHLTIDKVGNRSALNNTIISGQQKILRTSLEPYKCFFNVFHRDCLSSDIIICVGFSFSDFHINQILQEAIHLHDDNFEKLKFINITNSDEINDVVRNLENMLNNEELYYMVSLHSNHIKTNWYNCNNLSSMGKPINTEIKIFTGGFEAFLKDSTNWQELLQ